MSGNNGNGGGCGSGCSVCFAYICTIPSIIRNFPFLKCCLALPVLAFNHFVRSIIVIMCILLMTVSWFEFKEISEHVYGYCTSLIICLGLSFIVPKGYMVSKKKGQVRPQVRFEENLCQEIQYRPDQRRRPPIRHDPVGAEKPPVAALDNTAEQGQDAAPDCRNVQEVPFDFHHAEEPSESSNSAEPVSSASDEPLHQDAPSDSGNNLPGSSTDPSTQSTRSTSLDAASNDETTKTEEQK